MTRGPAALVILPKVELVMPVLGSLTMAHEDARYHKFGKEYELTTVQLE